MAGGISSCLRCHCHCRLACDEAVSAAISRPLASSAPPCMWCMRCMRLTHCSKPLVLRCRPEQPFVGVCPRSSPSPGSACLSVSSTKASQQVAYRWAVNDMQLLAASSQLRLTSHGRWYQQLPSLLPSLPLPLPIGVRRGRECGNQQPIHVISSSLYVVYALHANGALQQAAGAPMST